MDEKKILEHIACYLVLKSEDYVSGEFLEEKIYKIVSPKGLEKSNEIISGQYIDTLAYLLEENNFFGDWISGINHILSNTNAQIIPIKNGEEIGPVKGFSAYDINGKMVFEPKIIEKKQYLDMLRNKEGFIEYLNTLDINLPQITIQRGMVKTNRGDIKPISEIADLLYN